jgi:ABC-type amino acid transport substrate-binding protein
MKSSIFLVMLLISYSIIASEQDELVFATYNSPPYQYVDSNIIKGTTVSTVQCIFHKLNQKTTLSFYPLKRALRELSKNNIDGVFPVHANDKTNRKHSSPISIEKWYWLTNFPLEERNTLDVLSNKTIAVVNGSPAHEWLLETNLTIDTLITTRAQLLKMFITGKVDAIIIDDNEAYRDLQFHRKIESLEHYWRFIKFESHHLIFSDQVMVNNPKLIDKFNEKIPVCNPLSLKLSLNEKQVLKKYLTPYLSTLYNYLTSAPSITELKEVFTAVELDGIDVQWQSEAKNREGILYNFVYKSALSQFLINLQNSSSTAITEIIAIDSDGYTIGLSKITTDLYQGDEAKFLNTYPGGPGSIYISDINYDESTQIFQSQVSFSVPKEISSLGVITFGVNVEKIIKYHDLN